MRNYVLPFVCLSCWFAAGSAQPSGMEVLSGAVDLHTQSHLLQIAASDRAIIQWDNFSIGAQETTRFVLPDASSAILNRVSGAQMSELMGVLQSNGQVFLINPQGVFVGPNATIDTASFIASTFDVLNEDFLAKADLLFQGDSTASIVNLGTISTQMGDVVLLARHVDNQGLIQAPNGTVALGAGTKVLLQPTDSTKIYIETSVVADAKEGVGIHNQGSIQALLVELQADGNPYQHAIRHDGQIDALGISEQNGRILLVAEEGQIYITGQLKASAAEQIAVDAGLASYGEISVSADEILVVDQARFDVSNASGGGLIRLGFERQEGGGRARGLWTGKEVQFNADATVAGNGGHVLLWGQDTHIFLSSISAQGGPLSGDGGFVDVSTRGFLLPEGFVTTFAVNGEIGTLLYDPTNITINNSAMDTNIMPACVAGTCVYMIQNPAAPSVVSINLLQGLLGSNNVVISTDNTFVGPPGDITIGDPLGVTPMSITWGAATTLRLFANNNILIYGQVLPTGSGAINFTANGDILFQGNAPASGGFGARLESVNGSITLLAGSDIRMNVPQAGVTRGSNLIRTTGTGSIFLTAGASEVGLLSLRAGTVLGAPYGSFIETTGAGNITIVSSGGQALTGGGPGALELIAGTTDINQSSEIRALGAGSITITTGLPVDVIDSGVNANGTVVLQPGGTDATQWAQIFTGPMGTGVLTVHILHGDLKIRGGEPMSPNQIFGRIAQLGTTTPRTMAVFVDGNLFVGGPTNGPTTSVGSLSSFGVYTLSPNSAFNLTVSGDVGMTMGTGPILIGSQNALTVTNSITTISILGNIIMTSTSVGVLGASISNAIFGDNEMTLNVGGLVTLNTGGGIPSVGEEVYTVIGAGALGIGFLNVTIGGNLVLNNTAMGLEGGEARIFSESTGGANVIVNGSITINGSLNTIDGVPAGIGRSFIGCSQGPLVVSSGGDIVMTGGARQGDVHIGFPYAAIAPPITVNTHNLIMNAGAGDGSTTNTTLCMIGTGLTQAVGTRTGTITLNATGTLSMFGGTTMGSSAVAMIGHIGTTGATLGGGVLLRALSVHMQGIQATPNSFAQIGHGSTVGAPTFNNYVLRVIADRSIIMVSNAAGSQSTGIAQIWNRSNESIDTITLICDNANQTAPDYGAGFFYFGPNSSISGPNPTTPNPGTNVRIYTSVRIFNTVSGVGQGRFTSVPINGFTPGGTYPAPLGMSNTNEVWGAWADPLIPGGGQPYQPGGAGQFVIYYKRVGGIVVSDLASSTGVVVSPSTTFPVGNPEVYIDVSAISLALVGGSVTIDAETLSNLAPTNNILNGNSILWRRVTGSADLSWASTNALTLTVGNDVVVRDALIQNTQMAATVNIINVLAGRDCVIGTGDQSDSEAILRTTMMNKTITVVTGRDLVIAGSSENFLQDGTISSGTTGPSAINLTIGRDLMLQANGSTAEIITRTLTATIGRNVIQNGGRDTFSHSAISLFDSSSLSIGGYHSMNGGSGADATAEVSFTQFVPAPEILTYTCNGGLYLTGGSGPSASESGASATFILNGGMGAVANMLIANGNVIMNGGAGGGAFIETFVLSDITLNLNVPNGSLILQGNPLGSLNSSMPVGGIYMYGSAGIFAGTNSSSPINITVGGDIRLVGGNGPNTTATIGNLFATGTSGAISVTVAGSLIQQGGGTIVIPPGSLGAGAGTGPLAVAQIVTRASPTQSLTLDIGGDYLVTGGAGYGAAAGVFGMNAQADILEISVDGDMILQGGSHALAEASCRWNYNGVGGTAVDLTIGTPIDKAGDLILRSGTGYAASAVLSLTNSGVNPGLQLIGISKDLVLTANSSSPGFSIAAITGTSHAEYTVVVGNNIVLNANKNDSAFIGSGDPSTQGNYDGAINITAFNDVMLTGSPLIGATRPVGSAFPLPNFTRGFAQIGHINGDGTGGASTLAGDITVSTAGSVIQNGGNNPGGYAQIGHGGYAKVIGTDTYSDYDLVVEAGRNINMNTPNTPLPGPAQIVNYGTGMDSTIRLVTDNIYSMPPESGPGSFHLSSGSLILTSLSGVPNPDTDVRIYTSVRLFNTIDNSINGTPPPPPLPVGVSNALEEWGVYSPMGMPPTLGYKIYYKRIGGLLISFAATDGANFVNGVYTFILPEAIINYLDLSGELDNSNVLIDSTGMSQPPLGAPENSIVITAPIGWVNPNTLTIHSSQDLILNHTMIATNSGFPVGSSGITLSAARNIFIGDGTESAQTGMQVDAAPIHITAGGSIGLYGLFGGTGVDPSVLISSFGAADIIMTASNDLIFGGGGVANAGVRVRQNDGDLVLNVLGGDLIMRAGSAAGALIELVGIPPSGTEEGDILVTVSTGSMYMVGGSASNTFSAINNSFLGANQGDIRISVLQGNLMMQGGSGASSVTLRAGVGVLHVDVAGDMIVKAGSGGNGFLTVLASELVCNAGRNIFLRAGSTGGNGIINISGMPLTITAGDSITLIAQNNSSVIIGSVAPIASDITVTAGAGITLQGEISGQESDTVGFAKIGHTPTNAVGNITVTAGDAITLKAGSFNGAKLVGTIPPSQSVGVIMPAVSSARIGLSDMLSMMASGSTTINARALTIQAGLGAQGGSASVFASGAMMPLTLNISAGDLYIQSGGSPGSSATAEALSGSVSANIANGNILLLAGVGSGNIVGTPFVPVIIPNTAALKNGTGNLIATCAGSLTITGGIGSNSNASLGASPPFGTTVDALTVNVGTDVIMTSGFGTNSYANIGCTNFGATTLTLTAGGNILLTATGHGYAKIGHGSVTAGASTWISAISVTAGGDIVLSGTGGSNLGVPLGVQIAEAGLGFAQIGHVNSQSSITSIAGNIDVTAGGSLILNPGLKSTAYARIGHGGITKLSAMLPTDVFGAGLIRVVSAENVYLLNSGNTILSATSNTNIWGQLAQIVNPCAGGIWIVADQADPVSPNAGTGHFVFTTNGFISTTTPVTTQAKIYTAVRVFNSVQSMAIINGAAYTAAALPPSVPSGPTGHEAWGYYYATDGTNPLAPANFTIYYKRVGGILLSGDPTSPGTVRAGTVYTFTSREPTINTTNAGVNDLRTGLNMNNIFINTAALPAGTSPNSNNSILFRHTWTAAAPSVNDPSTLVWTAPTQLSLTAQQDIAVSATMSPTNAGAAIVLTAGRDVLLETSGLAGQIAVAGAPVTITAGRDYRSMGPSLGFTIGGQIHSTGSGAIAITAGRDVSMLGGAYVGSATQYAASGGNAGSIEGTGAANITVTATRNMLMQGGYGSGAGLSTDGSIAMNAGENILMQGGSGALHSFVRITTPGLVALAAGGDVLMLGGWGLAPGLSNVDVLVNGTFGGVVMSAGGSIIMVASPSISSQSPGVIISTLGTQPIIIESGGDLTMISGPGGGEAGIWGVTGVLIDLSIGGYLTINSANLPLAILLQDRERGLTHGVAHIGGNFSMTTPTVHIEHIGGNLILNGDRNTYATIGGNGVNAPQDYTGDIIIDNVSGSVILNAYSGLHNNDFGFVQIGVPNNRTSAISTINSTVMINAQENMTLNGGSTPSAFARIGNGGQTKESGADVMQGNVWLTSQHGDLTLNSHAGSAMIAAFNSGTVMTLIEGNTTLNGSSSITSELGLITLLTGVTQTLNDSSRISNTSSGGISIVADNLYPNPPQFGLGRILTAPNTSITTPGPLRLYSAAQQLNKILGPVNGIPFTPGPLLVNSQLEQWFKYYPQLFGGFPFTFFYKTSFEGSSGGIEDAIAANSTLDMYLPLVVPVIRVWEVEDDSNGEQEMQFKSEAEQ